MATPESTMAEEERKRKLRRRTLAQAALGHYANARHAAAGASLGSLKAQLAPDARLADRVAFEHNAAVNSFSLATGGGIGQSDYGGDGAGGADAAALSMLAKLQSIRDYVMKQRSGENAAELAAREQAEADGTGTATAATPSGASTEAIHENLSSGLGVDDAAKTASAPPAHPHMPLLPVETGAPRLLPHSSSSYPESSTGVNNDDDNKDNNDKKDHAATSDAESLLPGQMHVDMASFKGLAGQRIDLGIEDAASAEIFARDPQLSTIIFNEAVLYCRLGRFRSSLRRLDLLFQNLMILDHMLVIRVCYLCLDIYFLVFRGLDPDSPHLRDLEVCAGVVLEALELRGAQGFDRDEEMEEDTEEAKEEEVEQQDGDKKEEENDRSPAGASPSASKGPARGREIPGEATLSVVASKAARRAHLKFNIRLYRAKLRLIMSNAKDAKKEIKSALEVHEKEVKPCLTSEDEGQRTAPALFLKANLEYLRGNFKKCVKLLNASMGDGSLGKVMHLNNMACVNFRSHKYAMATMCFAQSLSLMEEPGTSSANAMGDVSNVSRCEVLYNVGLQLLASGKELGTALDCFYRSSIHLHMRPRVWIRMAECCIYAHNDRRQAASQDRVASSNHEATITSETLTGEFQNDLVAAVVGGTRAGGQDWVHPCRRILLPLQNLVEGHGRHTDSDDIEPASNRAGAELSLTFATMCLENALSLLAGDRFRSEPKGKPQASSGPGRAGVVPAGTSTPEYALSLRLAAMIDMSYCALCQNHPVRALEYAQKLLHVAAKADASSVNRHQYFAHTYAAEALCMMNKSAEALTHATNAAETMEALDAENGTAPSSKIRDQEDAAEPRLPLGRIAAHHQPSALRSALCVNLATVRLQQGELDLAEQSLMKALRLQPTSKDALKALIYLRLRQGDTQKALRLLQERQPFR
jgi:CCR4-NOT transcription complex subunit 10